MKNKSDRSLFFLRMKTACPEVKQFSARTNSKQ
nr:MAG TPA: hypothetical protein [Caudoviricetes sp.]